MADVTTYQSMYESNSDYDLVASVSKARNFIIACRGLLLTLPKSASRDDGRVELNPEMIQAEMDRAIGWLSANSVTASDGAGTSLHDFTDYRS